jgi:glycosyltransferase involved in cell wall biosynthesis
LLIDMVDIIGRQFKKNKTLFDLLIIQNKKLFDSVIVKNSYEIFTISTELLRKYQKMFPAMRVTMSIPSTVDIADYKKTATLGTTHFKNDVYAVFNETETIKIFYAGTITRLNGIDFFLTAVSKVLQNNNLKLKIVFAIIDGSADDLKTLVEKKGLSSYLLIVPPVEQRYLPILLSRTDILFIPEQGVETAHAGFPGKTSEFLLSGRPVITTRFSDLGHYLKNGENACISDIGDLDSYSASLKKLLIDPNFRIEIGKKGLKTAENIFSHEKCAQPYFDSIQSYYKN